MEIKAITVFNRASIHELLSIHYDFDFILGSSSKTQRILDKYKDGKFFETKFFPAYKVYERENRIFSKEIANIKKINAIYPFYKKIEEDIFSLSLDFDYEIFLDKLTLVTNLDGYFIKLDIDINYPFVPKMDIYIHKQCSTSNIIFELIIDQIKDNFDLEKVFKGKNKIKYLFDTKVIDFINKYNNSVVKKQHASIKTKDRSF